MASGILGIALSGLNAAQAGMRTAEHNIANVNTVGYRRQEVQFAAVKPDYGSTAYFGNGVGTEAVRRIYNQFLENEAMLSRAQLARHQTYSTYAAHADNLLGSKGTGLAGAPDSFFSAVNEVANDPTSSATRQILLAAGNNLAGRFNLLGAKLQDAVNSTNKELATLVDQVNALSSRIVGLNGEISRAESINGGSANDLRDQRDQVLSELNDLVNLTIVEQADGALNVFIGSGQALVVGSTAYRMSTALDAGDASLRVPVLDVGGTTINLDTKLLTGGTLGGLLAVREEVLLPALRDLGRIAIGVAEQFNSVHAAGYALDGVTTGIDFFGAAAGMLNAPIGHPGNSGTGVASASLLNAGQLASSEYQLSYDGVNYTLTRLSDGASRTGSLAQVTDLDNDGFDDQGFTLAMAGAPAAGDTWSLRLTQTGASLFSMNPGLTSADQIAAAAVAGAPGDNANAVALAALQFDKLLDNGNATFASTYTQTVSRTAALAASADWNVSAFSALTEQAENARKSVSGVSLDEEAVNLIRFQQAYQASAKAMQVASQLFSDLIGILR